jgi:hypothetical protein
VVATARIRIGSSDPIREVSHPHRGMPLPYRNDSQEVNRKTKRGPNSEADISGTVTSRSIAARTAAALER